MITRRCTQRLFLLRPDSVTNEIFLYCLAVAAKRFGIEVNWVEVQSNHYHLGIHDPDGKYPEFLCYFHSLLGRAMNVHRGRRENFWSTEQTSVVELLDPEAVFAAQTYGLTNPVKDHLVDKVHNWPGVCSLRYQLSSGSVTTKRPRTFFKSSGRLPKQITLEFVRPREFAALTEEEWREEIRAAIAKKENEFAAERVEKNIKLVGRKAVRQQSPSSSPKNIERRRRIRPRVASKNKQRRVHALKQLEEFVLTYRRALRQTRRGETAIFPPGTYLLRVRGLVSCAQPPPI